MKSLLSKCILCALLLGVWCAAAQAAPVQRIHQIQKPLFNVPAIVKPGDAFELAVKPPEGLSLAGAYLYGVNDPGVRIALTLDQGAARGGLMVYQAAAPAGAPEALYNLAAHFPTPEAKDDDVWDHQPHAVKLVKEFKKDFDFIQLTDIHFNVQDIKGRDMSRMRGRVLEMVSAHNPEFVLFTGDLMLNPDTYDADYVTAYEEITHGLAAPVFMVPGNHELYYGKTDAGEWDGMDYWTAAFGPTHYAFDYGTLHVAGINTFDWPRRWRNRYSEEAMFMGTVINAFIGPEQWQWLQDDLKSAATRGQHCIAATHIPIGTMQGGKTIGVPPDRQKVPGPNVQQFTDVLNAAGCSHIFVGHMHYDKVNTFGNLQEVLTRSSGISIGNDPEFKWGYRVVHIKDGQVAGSDIVEIGWSDLD